MTALFEGLALVADERPPDVPTCVDCGAELEWKGKGRKPTKCDEHRKVRGEKRPANAAAGGQSSNEKLAAQATDVLAQINDWLAIACMMGGLHGTAGELAARQDAFREQALSALMLDPALCRSILRGGQKSGKAALGLAYLTMLGSVAPTALVEVKELRAAKRAAAESSAPVEDAA